MSEPPGQSRRALPLFHRRERARSGRTCTPFRRSGALSKRSDLRRELPSLLPAGGVEWFKAAHGAWHSGGGGDSGHSRGFQLWLALPPDEELGRVENVYL